jgi:Mn2+/Fe2+ NRAMP family transporter
MKALIVITLVAVLAALALAGLMMLRKGDDKDDARNPAMARALAMRVGLSIALFLFILLAWQMGWIRPTGVPISA